MKMVLCIKEGVWTSRCCRYLEDLPNLNGFSIEKLVRQHIGESQKLKVYQVIIFVLLLFTW